MRKVLQITMLLLCLICVNSSCNKEKTKSEQIKGKWECVIATSPSEPEAVEHNIGGRWEFGDKTVSIRDGYNQDLGEYSYSYNENKHILVIGEDDNLSFYVTKLTKDVLILDGMAIETHYEFNRFE